MDIYQKIDSLVNQNSTKKMEFYQAINLTHSGFRKMMLNKSLRLDTLVKISAFFNIPIETFITSNETSVSDFEKKYYTLLEKYNICLEEKETLRDFRKTVSHQQSELNEPENIYQPKKQTKK